VNSDWTQFLLVSAPSDHGAHVYTDASELAQSVGAYLAAGFDLGEPAVVIATPEHWSRFAERLALCGWGDEELQEQGLLWFADADETLAAIMADGAPSWDRFEQVVGGLMDRVEERFPGGRIRAFGEMVDLLCQRDDPGSAAGLEDLWNRLAQQRSFSLLCAYRLDVFDRATQVSVLPDVCRSHSHVRPAEDPVRLQQAVDSALDEALGADAGKVYALMSDRKQQTKVVPAAQLALMWVSAEMPAHAERILASARATYTHESAGP
jgi:MEDS: MEthanogen/methylotroph, DcmR Sensory domain